MSEPADTGWGVFEKSWAGNPSGWWYTPGRIQEAGGAGGNMADDPRYGLNRLINDPYSSPPYVAPTGLVATDEPMTNDEGVPVYTLQPATTATTPAVETVAANLPSWVVPVGLIILALVVMGGSSK